MTKNVNYAYLLYEHTPRQFEFINPIAFCMSKQDAINTMHRVIEERWDKSFYNVKVIDKGYYYKVKVKRHDWKSTYEFAITDVSAHGRITVAPNTEKISDVISSGTISTPQYATEEYVKETVDNRLKDMREKKLSMLWKDWEEANRQVRKKKGGKKK